METSAITIMTIVPKMPIAATTLTIG